MNENQELWVAIIVLACERLAVYVSVWRHNRIVRRAINAVDPHAQNYSQETYRLHTLLRRVL